MKTLTAGQATAMYVLLQGRAIGKLVRKGKDSDYTDLVGNLAPHNLRVNSVAAEALVTLGYARSRNVLIDGREVKGADLVHLLGHWSTKYEITERGRRAWQKSTARERYGYPEFASMKPDEYVAPRRAVS
jgi:hypothetical protein